jgi:hypothetical protein
LVGAGKALVAIVNKVPAVRYQLFNFFPLLFPERG